ncbi:MAG: phosphatidylserine decarboxylase [Candidatus Odinarchaeota archaeon]
MGIKLAKGHEPLTAAFAGSGLLFGILSLVWAFHWLLLLFFSLSILLFLFNLLFFRDPERRPALVGGTDGFAVLAPADGIIFKAGVEKFPLDGKEMIVIKIRMSLFDVHVNRCPFDARIGTISREEGSFWPMSPLTQGKTRTNAKQIVELVGRGFIGYMVQISGFVARRCVLYHSTGTDLNAGERIGMIRYGSEVDTWLPADQCQLKIAEGKKTRAGKTVIAIVKTE